MARGLTVRHVHGSHYMARDFKAGLTFVGITSSPAVVRAPGGNGVAERAFRTLTEQCLYLHRFHTIAEARQVIAAFIAQYHEHWLVAKRGCQSPAVVRRQWAAKVARSSGHSVQKIGSSPPFGEGACSCAR